MCIHHPDAARYEGSIDYPGQPETRFEITGNYMVREMETYPVRSIRSFRGGSRALRKTPSTEDSFYER